MAKTEPRGGGAGWQAKTPNRGRGDREGGGYSVGKGGPTVNAKVEAGRDTERFSGFSPPALAVSEAKGWQVGEKLADREDGVVWRCAMCKWLYKEDQEGVPFAELPDDWRCHRCNVPKPEFERIGQQGEPVLYRGKPVSLNQCQTHVRRRQASA